MKEHTMHIKHHNFISSVSKILSHTKLLIQQGSRRKHPKAAQLQPVMTGLSLVNLTAWCKMSQACILAVLHWTLPSDISSIINYCSCFTCMNQLFGFTPPLFASRLLRGVLHPLLELAQCSSYTVSSADSTTMVATTTQACLLQF